MVLHEKLDAKPSVRKEATLIEETHARNPNNFGDISRNNSNDGRDAGRHRTFEATKSLHADAELREPYEQSLR